VTRVTDEQMLQRMRDVWAVEDAAARKSDRRDAPRPKLVSRSRTLRGAPAPASDDAQRERRPARDKSDLTWRDSPDGYYHRTEDH